MNRVIKFCLFGALAGLAINTAALERLESSTLLEQCATHEQALSSLATASCRAYLHGFLGGSFAIQTAQVAEEKTQSQFMQRAQRTRLGEARLRYGQNRRAGYCVPEQITLSELVAEMNRYAAIADDKPEWANDFLIAFLKASYPCK